MRKLHFYFVVLGSLACALQAIAQGLLPDTFFDYPQTTLTGTVSAEPVMPLERCRDACASRSGCVGFSHIPESNICRMFSGIGSAQENNSATSGSRLLISSYRSPTNPPGSQSSPSPQPEQAEPQVSFRLYRNRDLTSRPFSTRNAGSVGQCETICRNNSDCKAFTYDKWNRRCFLKRQPGILRITAKSTSGVVATLPQLRLSGAAVRYDYYNGQAFPGNGYRSVVASSRDQCAIACGRQGQCIAFSFRPAARRCTLYATAGEYGASRGTYSGAKVQD